MLNHIYLDKSQKPDNQEILTTLGKTSLLWQDIHSYISEYYDFIPELIYFTRNYGWTIRYRKSNKTLSYFFPKKNSFSILIVLGTKEAEQVKLIKDKLNENVIQVFENTDQLHDGRWLWIEIMNSEDISSFKELLSIKKKPKNV